jgi:flavin-dependent dehydrogenase
MRYDVAIIGGGIAGLTSAILLAKSGFQVILFEKATYPKHKVCGEYVSNEVKPFLQELGFPFERLQLPEIKHLEVVAEKGAKVASSLDLGGFGISRYLLDNELYQLALHYKVEVKTNTPVKAALKVDNYFEIITNNDTFKSTHCLGAFGKKSNLDIALQRKNARLKKGLQNFIGVKYHFSHPTFPKDKITLFNFKGGYAGFSAVENDIYCFCYLIHEAQLKKQNNAIPQLEKAVLHQNKALRDTLADATVLWQKPLTISQIDFNAKTKQEQGMLMVGDTAGLIAPLCGNGMAMAFKSAYLFHHHFLQHHQNPDDLAKAYSKSWNQEFATRLWAGRNLQYLFGKGLETNSLIFVANYIPGFTPFLIRLTHGRVF